MARVSVLAALTGLALVVLALIEIGAGLSVSSHLQLLIAAVLGFEFFNVARDMKRGASSPRSFGGRHG